MQELHESSEWEVGILRHQRRATPSASHPRTGGTVSSFRILSKVSEGCTWDNDKEAAGREEPRDPRSPETPEVASGTGRVRSLREGVWRAERWAVTRPHSEPRLEKGVHHRHTSTPEPALHNTQHAAHTRVLATPVRTQVLHVKHGATQSTAQCARKHLSARSVGSHADLHLPTTSRVSV